METTNNYKMWKETVDFLKAINPDETNVEVIKNHLNLGN